MDTFEIKKNKLNEVLNKFKKISEDLEGIRSDIKSEYGELLQNYWTGESANQFRENSDAWDNNLNYYNGCIQTLMDIISSQALPGADDLDSQATGLEGILGGYSVAGGSEKVRCEKNYIETLKNYVRNVISEYDTYKLKLENVGSSLDMLSFSSLNVSGDISGVCNNIDDRCDKLNALISELDSYQSNVENFEENICAAIAKIKGPKDWESLKADNLLQIVTLLGTKGLEDYEYEKKTGNLILTVNGENVKLCAYGGDPINMSTGNYVYSGEFLAQKGLFPLAFNITYNSVDKNKASLGRGFYSDIDMRMEITDSKAKVIYADGRREVFLKNREGGYTNINETSDKLRKLNDLYELKQFEGDNYIFDGNGRLLKREDGKGNHITYLYDDSGMLQSKRNNSNECIKYLYDNNGKLVEVCDTNGRSIELSYQDNSLVSIKNEIGNSFSFEYENGFPVKLMDFEGKLFVENTYDEMGKILSQHFADGVKLSFKYDKDSTAFDNGETEVVYHHDNEYRTVKITENGKSSIREFNRSGLCIFDIDRKGNKTIYYYNSDKKLIRVELPENINVNISYDAKGYLNGISVNGEEKLRQYNDRRGNPTEIFNALGQSYNIEYNENSKPLKIIAPNDSKYDISYDEKGNAVQITGDMGVLFKYTYDELNRVTCIESNTGGKRKYKYNELGDITEVTNPLGNRRIYEYTANRQISKIIDFDGKNFEVEYNNINLPVKLKDKNGNIIEYAYDNIRRLSKIKKGNANVEKFEYDIRGNLTKVIAPDGSEKSFIYDDNRNIIRVIYPTGLIEDYSYDKLNRCIAKEFSDGMKSEFIYEGDKLIKMILPYGSVSYEYDKCGRIIKQISDTGVSEAYSYDSMNRISESCDTLGNITGYEYSRDGKIKSVNLSNDIRYLFKYDNVGRLIKRSRKACTGENNLSYRYDNFGRVCEISTDTGRSNAYQYDGNGNIISITDGIGNKSCFKYGMGNLLEEVIDGDGLTGRYAYDSMNNLVEIRQYDKNNTNNCQIRKYHRDNMGRISKVKNADGSDKSMEYNSLGQMVKKIDEEGFETDLSYNEAGLLTSVKCSDGNYINYEYNEKRFVKAVTGSFGSMEFCRDEKGLVKKATFANGHTVSYEYDKFGRTIAIVYPDKKNISYNYDSYGRLTETVCGNTRIKLFYDDLGRVIERLYGDGSRTCYEYNDLGSPVRLTYTKNESLIAEYKYGYDAVGNKTAITFNRDGKEKNYKYIYDSVGRITCVNLDGKNLREYSYDIFGNRIGKVDYTDSGVITTTYTYKNGKLFEEFISGYDKPVKREYQYDKRGNLIKKLCNGSIEAEYIYNALGQLINIVSGNDKVIYEYDGLGHRTAKIETKGNITSVTNYVLDIRKQTDNILWKETEGKSESFIWDMQLISEIEDERSINIICDELGSVILKGDKEFEYGEFGEALGDKPENFGFAGLTVDEISGNYLSATRMYDEHIGRFLGKDKIKGDLRYGFTQNEYTYCYNSPLVFVDSTGNAPVINNFHFISPISPVNNWCIEAGLRSAEKIPDYIISVGSDVTKSFLEYMPEEIPDVVMNCANDIWTETIPSGVRSSISDIGHEGIKGLRGVIEYSGFSDYLNEQTVSSKSDVLLNKFDFYKDSKGIIHVLSHCWQRKWGYNPFYDYIFNAATSMNKAKFKFNVGSSDFTLWIWKGDYVNFGAGGEIGIYKGEDWHVNCYIQSRLKMNMNLTLKDGTLVADWDAYDQYQWWLTSFNPAKEFQDIKAEDLILVGMVDFNDERQMWKGFVHTAEFDDHNEDKINDNWCLDFVHRNAFMKWDEGNKN